MPFESYVLLDSGKRVRHRWQKAALECDVDNPYRIQFRTLSRQVPQDRGKVHRQAASINPLVVFGDSRSHQKSRSTGITLSWYNFHDVLLSLLGDEDQEYEIRRFYTLNYLH